MPKDGRSEDIDNDLDTDSSEGGESADLTQDDADSPVRERTSSWGIDSEPGEDQNQWATPTMSHDLHGQSPNDAPDESVSVSNDGESKDVVMIVLGRKFILAPEWSSIPSARPSASMIRRVAHGRGSVVIPSRDGSMPMAAYSKRSSSVPCLSASLAKAGSDGIFVIPLSDGRWWSAAIYNNSVPSGFEVIGDPATVVREIETFITTMGLQINIRLHPDIYPSHDLPGSDVISEPDALLSSRDYVYLKRDSSSQKNMLIVGVAVILIASVAGFFYINSINSRPTIAKIKTAEEIDRENLEAYKQAIVSLIASTEHWTPWIDGSFRYGAGLMRMSGVAGWRFNGFECTKKSCVSAWFQNTPTAQIGDFWRLMGIPENSVIANPQAKNMKMTQKQEPQESSLRAIAANDLATLPLSSRIINQWFDVTGIINLSDDELKIDKVTSKDIVPVIKDKKKIPKSPPKVVLLTFKVSGTKEESLARILLAMSNVDIEAKKITVKFNAGTSLMEKWLVEGEYVAQ